MSERLDSVADWLLGRYFNQIDGELTIGGVSVGKLADAYGTPAYVYDAGILRRNYREMREAVAGFAEVYFSIKANPNPAVVKIFVEEGAGLEVASAAEYLVARSCGCAAERVLFAGPGKSQQELEHVVSRGIGEIHLESFDEIHHVAEIARRLDVTVPVALRVNPTAAAEGGAMRMGGRPAAFGFDEEVLNEAVDAVAARPSLFLTGVHMFAGTQILSAEVLLTQWAHAIAIAGLVAARLGRPLQTLDLGGGLGVPYHSGDAPLDLDCVRDGIPRLLSMIKANPLLGDLRVILEPGRYLAASAGVYLMGVRAVKNSRGTRFVIADGGMHHHLAASGNLGQVIKRDYPIVAASAVDAACKTPAMLVGPLCTPLDTLGRQTLLPPVEQGSLVAVLQSGAYGLSASPIGFLSHPTPAEVMVDEGAHWQIRPPGTFDRPIAPAGQVGGSPDMVLGAPRRH